MSLKAIPRRPYTSYNFFFQLEREYIIQIHHGYRPTIDPSDVFDPSAANYHGPPLPSRYQDLLLPYDWHIPGKMQRRKRSHRRTHGKIGFHELNRQISDAWAEADPEVRSFCASLSAADQVKLKKIEAAERTKTTQRRASKKHKKAVPMPVESAPTQEAIAPSFDWAVNSTINTNASNELPSLSRMISNGSDLSQAPAQPFSGTLPHRGSYLTEVDMNDDEIYDVWKSIPTEVKVPPSSFRTDYGACTTTTVQPFEGIDPSYATASPCPRPCQTFHAAAHPSISNVSQDQGEGNERMSFIDSEYEMYKELGKQFSMDNKRSLNGILHMNAMNTLTARLA